MKNAALPSRQCGVPLAKTLSPVREDPRRSPSSYYTSRIISHIPRSVREHITSSTLRLSARRGHSSHGTDPSTSHHQFGGGWSVGVLLNRAERHPVATELYAMGPHAATRRFEIGDPDLGIESATGIDFSLHHQSEAWGGSLTAFYTDYADFIYAAPTDEELEGFPVYRYTQVDATFRGFEAELTWHAWHHEAAYFDMRFLLDWVDTDIQESEEQLPRIPPMRAGVSVEFGAQRWMIRSALRHSFEQDNTAPFEEPSDAYTDWSASLLLDLPVRERGEWHLLVSGVNLLDEEIRPHTSPIKDVAPAPGRHLRVTVSVTF